MTEHAVAIAGGGPTGLMLAGELALAGVDVAIVERRAGQDLAGSRAGGLHSRTIEVLDQRGIADRFLSQGKVAQVGGFSWIPLDISDFPTRHNYGLALWQNHIERILAGWVDELAVPIHRGRDVTGVAQDATGMHAVGKLDGGRVRVMVTEQHLGHTSEPTLRDLSEGLVAVYGTDYGIHSPIWISRFTDMTRQATSYRDRRVLLAGDAAHVHYPVGGQGLSIGVQDAVNLGWKLAQVVNETSPESLLDTYHAERHPVAARVARNTMAQTALLRFDERIDALRDTMSELLSMDEPRKRFAAMMSGLDIHYDLGEGHPLLGCRMPDLDLVTANGPLRVFTLLHDARPVLLNLAEPGGFDITPWADRVQLIDATYPGTWELPVFGGVTAPTGVLIRPDGYVAWGGDLTQLGLA